MVSSSDHKHRNESEKQAAATLQRPPHVHAPSEVWRSLHIEAAVATLLQVGADLVSDDDVPGQYHWNDRRQSEGYRYGPVSPAPPPIAG